MLLSLLSFFIVVVFSNIAVVFVVLAVIVVVCIHITVAFVVVVIIANVLVLFIFYHTFRLCVDMLSLFSIQSCEIIV